ncbi:MAG TPA: hypothetical protein VHZ81_05755 [Galbitalea sp.]|jgi:hypothetical protein|nr:hypothetical protein [Galbitalea sp.]
MKYVAYAGETVLTTDGVGDAVVAYARALVADKSVDVVDIPVVVDEAEATASLLIGPGSPLLVVTAADHELSLRDETAIAKMRGKIAALGPHRVRASESFIADQRALTFDYL